MKEKIIALLNELLEVRIEKLEELESLRNKFLSKKGEVSALFNDFKQIPNEEKREIGQLLNELKTKAQERINALKEQLTQTDSRQAHVDLTRTADPIHIGT